MNGTIRLVDTSTGDPSEDLDLSRLLLGAVADGDLPRLVRSYRPLPTVAYSRRETHLPGFHRAVAACAASGYRPAIRPTGGRAVAYDERSVVIDVVEPVAALHAGHRAAFETVSSAIAGSLVELGVQASVGPVPGEYCPGEFSVGARGVVKLVGIAQRAVRGARLISAVTAVQASAAAAELLAEVYRELDFAWDPGTVGSVEEERGATEPGDLADRIATALGAEPGTEVAWHRVARRGRSAIDAAIGTP